ncbi:hypothetical protein HYW32_00090 [Candidatus Berkelbacteria bacterium]|nr:hypothetical protein [Candidatus Berkelbacteria bacterium]
MSLRTKTYQLVKRVQSKTFLIGLIFLFAVFLIPQLTHAADQNLFGIDWSIVSDPKEQTFENIMIFLKAIANAMIRFVLAIALIFLILNGYKLVTSSGNATQAQAAKMGILYTLLGIGVVFGSYMFLKFLAASFILPDAIKLEP